MNWRILLIIFIGLLFLASPVIAKEEWEKTDARVAVLEAQVAVLMDLLEGVSRGIDPETDQDTITFSEMNVQIVNGMDSTNSMNGTGNLIIGYNQSRSWFDPCPEFADCVDRRTGSHMLVIGFANNYTSWGGMVVGILNETAGDYASVSGGVGNTASGFLASVTGGAVNTASGVQSSVSGGFVNTASGLQASVSGGGVKEASG